MTKIYFFAGTLPTALPLLFPRLSKLNVSQNALTGELVVFI